MPAREPYCLGSFVRGEAYAESDLDVLAVRPLDVDAQADACDALGMEASPGASSAFGKHIVVGFDEIPALLRRAPVHGARWHRGVVLAGARTTLAESLMRVQGRRLGIAAAAAATSPRHTSFYAQPKTRS